MKIKKLVTNAFLAGLLGWTFAARAAESVVELVEAEAKSVASTASVTANYYYKYVLGAGASSYVSSTGTSATQNGKKAAKVSATFTGVAFTPDKATITLQQASNSKFTSGVSTLDTYTVYVAQADELSLKLGGANAMVATPTITTAAAWACKVADEKVATATVVSSSAKSSTVTITPVGAGTTTIDVRSGSETYGDGNPLRQRITVTVAKDEVDLGVIKFAHGEGALLTNELGQAIAWEDVTGVFTTDERIAKIVNAGGFAAVTNEVRDGSAEITVETALKSYICGVRCMTVEIEKTVNAALVADMFNKSNATIRVTSHVLTGVTDVPTNNILFIGSLCGNHTLVQDTISDAFLVLSKKGNVDWYLFDYTDASQSAVKDAKHYGSIAMNQKTMPTIPDFVSGGHKNLLAYLTQLDKSLDEATVRELRRKYAYVILEFDCNRVAHGLTATAANRALANRVAEKLAWYYDNDRVIWIIDPASDTNNKNDPSYCQKPSQYYRPSTFYISASKDYKLEDGAWELLTALLDPHRYLEGRAMSETLSNSSGAYYVGTKNELQAFYDKVENVTNILEKYVKTTTYSAQLVDTIQDINKSLSIVSEGGKKKISFFTWKNAAAPESLTNVYNTAFIADLPNDQAHWAAEPASSFKIENDYTVVANISNLTQETWNKFEIEIVDDGTFLKACQQHDKEHPEEPPMAVWDEANKVWHLDPNKGPAEVTLFAKDGKESVKAAAAARATMLDWGMEDPIKEMHIKVIDVTKVYDGISTNVLVVSVTDEDGEPVKDVTLEFATDETGPWTFEGRTDVTDEPLKVYVKATAEGYYATTNSANLVIKPRHVDDPAKPGDPASDTGLDFGGEGKDKVPYKGTEWEPEVVCTNSLGTLVEGEDYEIEYFDNVDATDKAGIVVTGKGNYTGVFTNYFEITKVPLTVTAYDQTLVYGAAVPGTDFYTFKYEGFVNDEDASVLEREPTFGSGYTTKTLPADLPIAKATDGVAKNYEFVYVNGTLKVTEDGIKIGGKGPFDPEHMPEPPAKDDDGESETGVRNVIKVYDGVGTNIVVDVTWPTDDYTVTYSTDGGKTYGPAPSFVDVVDGAEVWYKVEAPGFTTVSNYAYVTVLPRPVTVTADPQTKTYGEADPELTATVGEGFIGGPALVYMVGRDEGEDVAGSPYAITPEGDELQGNYKVTYVPSELKVVAKSIGPDPDDPTKPGDPDIVIPELPSRVYDGTPYEPEVVITNLTANPSELVEGRDYTLEYFDNIDATEEAYVVITGIGNYDEVFTNRFTILPREVTLRSGTKTMYLDPEKPGEKVVCSNELVWVAHGSFVTNAATGLEDSFTVTTPLVVLESSEPCGPVDNEFAAEVAPGLATNYVFAYEFGELAILSTPTNAHAETHEEVPTKDGKGIVDIVMDNEDAGKYAADRPPELNDLVDMVEKGPAEDVEVRLLISENYVQESFEAVKKAVVDKARKEGKKERDIAKYQYEAFDISIYETHFYYEDVEKKELKEVTVRDIGNEIDEDHMLTITIPYAFNPKLVEFSVWRNHTNESADVENDGVAELPYSEEIIPGVESWRRTEVGVVLHIRRLATVPVFKSLVRETPLLTGSMQWKYHRAGSVFYGGLDVVCTNGDACVISNLCYIYEDREDCYLRNLKSQDRLSQTSSVVYGGKTFGLVRLSETEKTLQASGLFVPCRYGVADSTFTDPLWKDRYAVPTDEERKIALAVNDIEKLVERDPTVVNKTLGYLTWQEDGDDTIYWCPLAEGLEPLPVDPLAGTLQPLTLAMANKVMAYGLPPTTLDSDPSLDLRAFAVADGVASGRVVTVSADGTDGLPGSNARLAMLGAASLADTFEEVAWPKLEADGTFRFEVPAGIQYFTVRLTVEEIIK